MRNLLQKLREKVGKEREIAMQVMLAYVPCFICID
jgi:hypothetical protein